MPALLRDAIAMLRDEGEPDFAAIQALADRIREEGPALSRADGQSLLGVVQQLEHKTREHVARTKGELRRVGNKRRALRGYGHLRSARKGQRLFKVA